MSTNMQDAIAKASANAKAPSAVDARNAQAAQAANARKVATPPTPDTSTFTQPAYNPASTPDFAAQLAAMQQAMQEQMAQQMAQFQAQTALLIAQKDAQIAELKTAKPAKAEKAPTIAAKHVTYTHDPKKNTLTLVIDLSADIIDPDTGAAKVSKSGNTTGVAQLSGSFIGADGRKVGVSLNAYRKI